MDYVELRQGIKYFESKWPPDRESQYTYSALRQRDAKAPGYWLHLERMDELQLGEDIIEGFLNRWKCRIPMSWEVVTGLGKAVAQVSDSHAALVNCRIEDVDFQGDVTLKGKKDSIRSVIDSIYSTFLQIKPKFGRVAASKLMHMALPDLFVMWDDGIIQHHCIPKQSFTGVKQKARSYVGFLILMQENICHVIESYPRRSQLTRLEVVQEVRAAHNNLPLPRLLDMANMGVRDCEQAICIACMRKAKARWATLGLVNTNDSMYEDSAD